MNKFVLAAVAATMVTPVVASATNIVDNRTSQVMNCVENKTGDELEDCIAEVIQWTLNNGAHEATKEITSHIEDVTGVKTINGGYQVHAAIAQFDQALAKGGSVSQEELDKVKSELAKARADLKQWQGWLNYWQPHAQSLEKHLRRAEDRIRYLEDKLDYYRSGGAWNPTNW